MVDLQTGQSSRLGAQLMQVVRCPHGKNTIPTSASMQILHSLASFRIRFSSSSVSGLFTLEESLLFAIVLLSSDELVSLISPQLLAITLSKTFSTTFFHMDRRFLLFRYVLLAVLQVQRGFHQSVRLRVPSTRLLQLLSNRSLHSLHVQTYA
jgi:hypothetical protein